MAHDFLSKVHTRPVIEDGSMNDGLIVEGFFMSSVLSPVWLLGYSPV